MNMEDSLKKNKNNNNNMEDIDNDHFC